MKVRLDKLTVDAVEQEIPDVCPDCGEPVAGSEVLVDTYDARTYSADLDESPDDDGVIRWEWGDDRSGEGEYVTGLRHTCGQVLASTEM